MMWLQGIPHEVADNALLGFVLRAHRTVGTEGLRCLI